MCIRGEIFNLVCHYILYNMNAYQVWMLVDVIFEDENI